MITFPCHCSNVFRLDEEMAGGLIQCPKCGRLNDVPSHEDLSHLEDDGTIKLEPDDIKAEPGRLSELQYVFTPGRTDAEGRSIDLRNTIEDVEAAGTEEIPLELRDMVRPGRPKYDPVTGDLVRPLDLKREEPPPPAAQIPLAKPAISYASGETDRAGPGLVLLELLMPMNVVVMFFIFLAHLFAQFIGIYLLAGFFLVAPVLLLLVVLIVAHYGCTIDEIGPTERDELPRPLRNAGWQEDLWGPFIGMTGGLMLCYLPALAVLYLPGEPALKLLTAGALALIGSIFVPAVVLTLLTSGTAVNVRPDRVLGVIRACGRRYVLTVMAWLAAAVVYGGAVILAAAQAIELTGLSTGIPRPWTRWMVVYPSLVVGIYLMHYFCWRVGLLYRGHHAQFPWILQHHVRQPQEPRPRGLKNVAEAQRRIETANSAQARARLREIAESDLRRPQGQ